MLVVHFRNHPVREPDPWRGCRFEEEANEPEVSLCNFCGNEIAYSDEPAWCNEACKEADEAYAAGDARNDLEEGA